MKRSNFKLLTKNECLNLISKLKKVFILNKHIWEKSILFETRLVGVINCLEVSLKFISYIAKTLGDEKVYFLSQNMVEKEKFSMVSTSLDGDVEHLPLEHSYLWASESLVIFSESMEWFILFNAELSIAIIVIKREQAYEYLEDIRKIFEPSESLLSISDILPLIEGDLALYDTSFDICNRLRSNYK